MSGSPRYPLSVETSKAAFGQDAISFIQSLFLALAPLVERTASYGEVRRLDA
jgi:hypothetical protein